MYSFQKACNDLGGCEKNRYRDADLFKMFCSALKDVITLHVHVFPADAM